jgi:putative ABC transport system ATP-binding protein
MLQQASEANFRFGERHREMLRAMLAELLTRMEVPHENAQIAQALHDASHDLGDECSADSIAIMVMRSGLALGIRLVPVELTASDVWELLLDGLPVAMLGISNAGDMDAWVLSDVTLGRTEAVTLTHQGRKSEALKKSQMRAIVGGPPNKIFFIAEPSLVCEAISSSHHPEQVAMPRVTEAHDPDHQAEHLPPLRRWLRLLKLDTNDIWTLGVFTVVVSFLDLATPLAVEQMVTTIGFASVVQPLIWIAVMLFAILTLSSIIKALQLFVVEILQRRMVVRIVADLADRFPRLERSAMDGIHGPEMANRFFDVITMQKATAVLLIDVMALVIQTFAGLLLLAIYSPFLLAFDIVLIMLMTLCVYVLGRGAVRTAIEESLIKYRIAHWLEDVIGNPIAFQVHGGEELSVDRANRLVVEYLGARRMHFNILIRQSLFALMLYAVSISALLSLGGWLVINNDLTIGQLVASVSVVAVVVGAFSKVGKSLEIFYDLMAATNKVGHLIDLPTIPPSRSLDAGIGPVDVRFRDLTVGGESHPVHIPNFQVSAGQRVAITGEGQCGKSTLLQTLAGLRTPTSGLVEIGGIDSRDVNRFADGSMVGLANEVEIFHSTVLEAITLNRLSLQQNDVREALQAVELWDEILALPRGLDTQLQTGGFPLSQSQAARLMLARSIIARPRLLLIDGTLDRLPSRMRHRIWENLRRPQQPWTLLIVSSDPQIIDDCSKCIELLKKLDYKHH